MSPHAASPDLTALALSAPNIALSLIGTATVTILTRFSLQLRITASLPP